MAVVEVKPYRLKLQTPYRWSKGIQHYRAGLIVRADFDGAVGWGEMALPPHVDFPGDAQAQEVRALLTGLDPGAPDFLHELELRECPSRVRCGVASAVLSAQARAAGLTLAAYLANGARAIPDWVPVNELIGDASPDVCVERAAAAIAQGQDTVKVKCTPERELDLTRIGAIRGAFAQLRIRIDPNESWPVEWAAEQLNAMAAFDIEYCEEPLPRGTPLAAYAQLRRETSVPIALDDSARSLYHVERIVELGAADALVLKAPRVGGPDRCYEISRYAESHGLRCTVTASLETSVGLYLGIHCAALTSTPIAAAGIGTARFFAENVDAPPPIVAGRMRVPPEPGLGFDPIRWWSQH
jgi:L-alanine-DL-glutamate epimerase-like enolase superfamily enzyme